MANIPKTSVMLLKAIAKDSQSARWFDFYSRYQPVMEGYLRASFPTLEAEDVIQDSMLALMQKLPGYQYDPDTKGHFRNYLIGVVKFKAIELLKKRKRESDKMSSYKDDRESCEPTLEERTTEDELREWRHHAYEVALAQLMSDPKIQERSRCVFARVAINHETPEMVAAAYGITRNAVDQIKNRMINKLRELVARMIEEESNGLA